MTNEQKLQITKLRKNKYGYAKIAKTLNLSVSSVKSYCQRNNLDGIRAETVSQAKEGEFCKECGKPVMQKAGSRKILFCSGECRQKWWNKHPEKVNRKAIYTFICVHCGKQFTAYGNNHRKYCCHSCYIADRFRGGASHA